MPAGRVGAVCAAGPAWWPRCGRRVRRCIWLLVVAVAARVRGRPARYPVAQGLGLAPPTPRHPWHSRRTRLPLRHRLRQHPGFKGGSRRDQIRSPVARADQDASHRRPVGLADLDSDRRRDSLALQPLVEGIPNIRSLRGLRRRRPRKLHGGRRLHLRLLVAMAL